MLRFFCYLYIFCGFLRLNGQHNTLHLGNSYDSNFEKIIYNSSSNIHSSFQPIFKSDLNFDLDSILTLKNKKTNLNWFNRKLYNEHFIISNGEDFNFTISPIVNLTKGKDLDSKKNTFTNTRGFIVQGVLGKDISFYSSFLENQSVFVEYLNDFITKKRVVPGQGYVREFKGSGFDYAMSSGYVIYRPNKMFTLQFGHGKHFIGNGYRSLLLSDNSFNYPFLRIQTTFGKIQYTNLYAELQDINYFLNNSIDNADQIGFPKKYISSHYLSLQANKKLNISLFESVVWRTNHAPGNTGFDINYLNPIILLRPVEFSVNSPDNIILGLNLSYNLLTSSCLYSQIILDEFSLTELRKDKGFWANKYGYQLGYKKFNLFGIDNLLLQTEYNYVRPYTYAHHNPLQNYAHYNQPLAHPLGANFSEKILMLKYRYDRWELVAKLIQAKYGADFQGDQTSYGSNLYLSTGSFASESNLQAIGSGRPSDFGVFMYQGNLTNVDFKSIDIAYVLNFRTNLKLNFGCILREFSDQIDKETTRFIHFGLKSDLFNHYYDF